MPEGPEGPEGPETEEPNPFFSPPVGTLEVPTNTRSFKGASHTDVTVAPTSAATREANDNQNAKLTESQLDFVTLVAQHWGTHGTLLTAEKALEQYELPLTPKQFSTLLEAGAVRDALTERGVSFAAVDFAAAHVKWKHKMLSARQLVVANSMLNILDTRSDKKKLQDLEVPLSLWQSWLRDPVFSGYLRTRSEALLGDSQHEAHLALVDKVRQGDLKAIQYMNQMTGRFDPTPKALNGSNFDVEMLMTKLIEIIIEEVTDPEDSYRIAERIKTLVTARNVVGALMNEDDVVAPIQVMPGREITPELQKLMDTGVGVND